MAIVVCRSKELATRSCYNLHHTQGDACTWTQTLRCVDLHREGNFTLI
jgi:hypothetical protein